MYWKEWLQTLLGLVVLLGILEMLLPPGDLAKFSKLVLGLVLMLAVLQPLTILLNRGLENPDLSWLNASAPEPQIQALAERLQKAAVSPFVHEEDGGVARQIEGMLLTIEQIQDVKVQIQSPERGESIILVWLQPFELSIENRVRRIVAAILNVAEQQIRVEKWPD